MIDPVAFKTFDIRGIVPQQLDGDGVERIGRGFAAMLKPTTVIVGRDGRLTGPEFHTRVIAGLTASGVNVIDIGQVSTDAFYYACATKDLPGMMVTASHNPAEYNGFKMVERMPTFVRPEKLLPFTKTDHPDAPSPGEVTTEDIIPEFLDHIFTIINPANIKPLRVVVDTSNGTQGPIWSRIQQRLPITTIPLFFEPDGNFPNHGNDVIQPEAQAPLRQRVIQEKADLGLIFDPDGDRCLVVDNRGVSVPGDFLTALLAVNFLEHAPGGTIIYDVRASDAVPNMIKAAGGKPVVWKVGHAAIKPKMREEGAVFGGEVSGHFFFKDFWCADCGLLSGLAILEYVSKHGSLGDKVAELESQYNISGEINSRVQDVNEVIERLKKKYADAEFNDLDGIEIRYSDWRFVVRPSNNEPLLRLTLEADSAEKMASKRDEVLSLIRA